MTDPIVDEVRRVREDLIQQHGGLEGYLKFCQQQDRARTRGAKQQAKATQGRGKTSASRKIHSKDR
jgi:hypothetical protein